MVTSPCRGAPVEILDGDVDGHLLARAPLLLGHADVDRQLLDRAAHREADGARFHRGAAGVVAGLDAALLDAAALKHHPDEDVGHHRLGDRDVDAGGGPGQLLQVALDDPLALHRDERVALGIGRLDQHVGHLAHRVLALVRDQLHPRRVPARPGREPRAQRVDADARERQPPLLVLRLGAHGVEAGLGQRERAGRRVGASLQVARAGHFIDRLGDVLVDPAHSLLAHRVPGALERGQLDRDALDPRAVRLRRHESAS